ncbi:MAG: hemin uptake protein HemP [Rhodospirillaceae bacterium]|nr:hemin uptake protein HemP [Rhodospirillaceae bacterium]
MKPYSSKPVASLAELGRTAEKAPAQRPRRVRIEDLLGAGRELIIEHRNEEYRLRMTSNSKLILTK